MTRKEKEALFNYLKFVIKGIAAAVGRNCEVVLHDFSQEDKSIIAIENGHVTGRQVGDGLDELAFQVLRRRTPADSFNYRGRARDGKTLRCSSILLRDETGKPFGAIGINIEISSLLAMQSTLADMTATSQDDTVPQENFERNVYEVLDKYVDEAVKCVSTDIRDWGKDDKIRFLRYLEERGAFLIRYSVERIAEFLSISRYTLYNYLDEIRQQNTHQPEATAPLPSERANERIRRS